MVRRALWAVVLMFALTVVTYVIFFQIPTDPARDFLVPNQYPTQHQIDEARHKLGTDRPVYVQYAKFVWRTVHLDLGYSYRGFGTSRAVKVTTMLRKTAPVTVSLFIGAEVIFLLVAFTLGTLGAVRPGSLVDRAGLVFVLLGISAHPLVVGLFLQQFLGFRWGLAPAGGYCPLLGEGSCSPAGWAHHMLLPWLTLAFLFAALYTRMVRSTVIGLLDEQWVRAARAKGAPEWRILHGHVLRHALTPVVTMLGMDLGFAFGSAIFVEQVFSLPGLGTLAYHATSGSTGFDLPVIAGVVLAVSFAIIVINLVVDLAYAWIDPRVRVA
jgi:peptide/nickel transport system permease protein